MIKCSCLCGRIEFEVEEVQGMIFNCHCSRCRKAHGAAFSTQLVANKDSLKFLKGRTLLSEFVSRHATRAFCSICGSRLANYDNSNGNYLSVSVSAIDSPIDLSLAGECFVRQKLNFISLNETVPHYEKLPS